MPERLSGKVRGVALPILVAFCGLMVIAFVDQVSFSDVEADRQRALEFQANELKVKIETYLQSRFTALAALAGFYETEGKVTEERFRTFSSRLYQEIGGFRSLQYANPENVVSRSYPPREDSPIGHRLLGDPVTEPFVRKAIQTGNMTVNDPYKLITTRQPGFVARKPIFRDGEYLGLAIGVFEVAPLVERVFSRSVIDRFDFRLVDSKGKTFFSSPQDFPPHFTREIVEVGDNFWHLDLVSKHLGGFSPATLRVIMWALGVISSLLLGGLVFLREERRGRAQQAGLFQAEKLAAVGRLAAGVAHEILNPLNNIGIIAQQTLLDKEAPEEARQKALQTYAQVGRITKITDSLKRVARQTSPSLTEVNVPTLIHSALDLVHHEIVSRGITVTKDFRDLGPIRADRDGLTQILLNLITNAVDAMDSKDERLLGIRAKTVKRDGNSWLRLQVSDTGHGILPEDLKRIFDPFFSRKQRQGGTGLGLSICRAIVDDHGGEIQVESVWGQGSTFTVYLPSSGRG